LSEPRAKFKAVHLGHAEIHKDNLRGKFAADTHRFGLTIGSPNFVPLLQAQECRKHMMRVVVIVHDQGLNVSRSQACRLGKVHGHARCSSRSPDGFRRRIERAGGRPAFTSIS
jgi:hypothetical protein